MGGPGTVSFRLDDPAIPQDQLPSVRPEATAAIVQTTLATILDTLERSRVRAVGLLGTDDRDKIFLAEQISYRCPNVQLFTIEGGLAFLHPEHAPSCGAPWSRLSYPLFSATQLTPSRHARRHAPVPGRLGGRHLQCAPHPAGPDAARQGTRGSHAIERQAWKGFLARLRDEGLRLRSSVTRVSLKRLALWARGVDQCHRPQRDLAHASLRPDQANEATRGCPRPP